MNHLSMIADRIAESPEGGTLSVRGHEAPGTGYMVGGAGPCLVFPGGRVDRYLLLRFLDRSPASDSWVGWWTDGATGRLYVDWSTRVGSEHNARDIASARGEIAFWDLANEREVRV